MSITIPTAFVETFSANVHMLVEQRMSYLRKITSQPDDLAGEAFSVERIGQTADTANLITDIHGQTPLNNTPNTRRWGYFAEYDVADLIDKQKKVKHLIDLESPYTIRHAGTLGRTMDDVIITAMEGSAAEGKNGGTSVALPAAQKIAAQSAGLTISKLRDAKRILDAAEVDPAMMRWFVTNAQGLSDLLDDPKIGSADFNRVQALVDGKVDRFMGFDFIRCERLNVDGSSNRLDYAVVQGAVRMGVPTEPHSEMSIRPDRKNAPQIYSSMSLGAVRVEDELVVQVARTEP